MCPITSLVLCCAGARAPSSALPRGKSNLIDSLKPKLIPINTDATHNVLAVSFAQTPEDILKENIAGFVHVYAFNAFCLFLYAVIYIFFFHDVLVLKRYFSLRDYPSRIAFVWRLLALQV